MIYAIEPVSKPRMTQRDKWAKRPAVLRYRAFCDEIRARKVALPESGARITFYIPMPESWPAKKRESMCGKPHQQRPDLDNLLKALFDAVYGEDCGVWHLSQVQKKWGMIGTIEINTGDHLSYVV